MFEVAEAPQAPLLGGSRADGMWNPSRMNGIENEQRWFQSWMDDFPFHTYMGCHPNPLTFTKHPFLSIFQDGHWLHHQPVYSISEVFSPGILKTWSISPGHSSLWLFKTMFNPLVSVYKKLMGKSPGYQWVNQRTFYGLFSIANC